jgi:hypothetical protein
MIKIKCTSGEIKVYPTTGVALPDGTQLPLVAPTYSGKKVIMSEGESMEVNPAMLPAIGGNGGELLLTNSGSDDVNLIRWHEIDNDPIYADEMQGYKDLDGNHTDENYTVIPLAIGKSYADKTIRSNAITVSVVSGVAAVPM